MGGGVWTVGEGVGWSGWPLGTALGTTVGSEESRVSQLQKAACSLHHPHLIAH